LNAASKSDRGLRAKALRWIEVNPSSAGTPLRFGEQRRRRILGATAIVVWCGSVAVGVGALQRYESTPAVAPEPPARWPNASRLLRRTDKPTLVVVTHPRCPCTRATLHELGVLMARVGERVTAHVLLVKPRGAGADWEKGELWELSHGLPGVTVTVDEGGREAGLFRAATSGQVVLFDSDGREIFAGGITVARGHEGDSPGLSRVASLITQGHAELASAPVFGCQLEDPQHLPEGVVALGKSPTERSP
jgi:hypothetical protein